MPLELVVFDVNETLSDMSPLAARFEQVGVPGSLQQTWFASVLRDGFGLTLAGAPRPFKDIASGVLRTVLAEAGADDPEGGTEHVLAGLAELQVHPDIPDGVRALREAGLRLVTMTNGAVKTTEGLLERAGVRDSFERLMSVEDAGAWKPARKAYEYAVQSCDVAPDRALMVAVHPWDLEGASRAGLRTGWLDRTGTPYPTHLSPPDHTASTLSGLAEALRG